MDLCNIFFLYLVPPCLPRTTVCWNLSDKKMKFVILHARNTRVFFKLICILNLIEAVYVTEVILKKHETLNPCWFIAGPPSATLDQQ